MHVPSGIRTHDPSNQAAADLRLRPPGHWDQQLEYYSVLFTKALTLCQRFT
jgi:hypothetical protein